jgi:hypothetical protein
MEKGNARECGENDERQKSWMMMMMMMERKRALRIPT